MLLIDFNLKRSAGLSPVNVWWGVEEGDSYMKLPTIQGLALPPPPAKSEAMQEVCMHVRTHMHLHSHTHTNTHIHWVHYSAIVKSLQFHAV